jgi:integrase
MPNFRSASLGKQVSEPNLSPKNPNLGGTRDVPPAIAPGAIPAPRFAGRSRLTAKHVETAKPKAKPYKLSDGRGLFLLVLPAGGKYWRMKYHFDGREKLLAFGTAELVSLAEARDKRDAARKALAEGIDPGQEKRIVKLRNLKTAAETFEAVALEWVERRGSNWSEKYRNRILTLMRVNLFPKLGALPVRSIDAPLLLAVLRPVEERGALEIVARLRQWAGMILRYAIATGRAERDCAADLRDAFRTRPTEHYRALSLAAMGEFLRAIDGYDGDPATALGLRLLALTFPRPGELRAAAWSEFDLAGGVWTVPAERMKMRREHLVPLSKQARAALRELHKLTGAGRLLFPNVRDPERPVTENTFLFAMYRLGYHGRATSHGFRATASTALNESGKFRSEVIERQLAHVEVSGSRRPYNRAEYWPERVKMMQCWADRLDQERRSAKASSKRGR